MSKKILFISWQGCVCPVTPDAAIGVGKEISSKRVVIVYSVVFRIGEVRSSFPATAVRCVGDFSIADSSPSSTS
ncbi:MAG: hypothetical protein ABSH52_12755 [Terriglobia bacterium]|jgi:hypothetical protein